MESGKELKFRDFIHIQQALGYHWVTPYKTGLFNEDMQK